MEFVSPLSRDECVRRLRACVDPSLMLFGSKPLVGGVRDGGFHVRRRIFYRNSFQPWMSGDFTSAGAGTRVRCAFAPHPFVVVFLAVWFGMLALFVAPVATAVLQDPEGILAAGPVLAVPVGMMLFGVGLVWFGGRLARGDRAYLEATIRRTLEAPALPG